MAPFLGLVGLAGFLVFIVLAVIHAFRRTGRAKRLGFASLAMFGLFVAAVAMDTPPASTPTVAPTAMQGSSGLEAVKGDSPDLPVSPASSEALQAAGKSEDSKKAPPAASFDAIKVTVDAQDMANTRNQYKTVVYIKNTSSLDFVGDVRVASKDVDGRTLGSDTIFAGEDSRPLLSGQQTYAILWLKRGNPPRFAATVSGRFVEPPKTTANVAFTIEASQVGPGAGTFWISVPDTAEGTLVGASRQILARYGTLQTITAYFYSDPKAAREKAYDQKNHPYATLEKYPKHSPDLSFYDTAKTLPIE